MLTRLEEHREASHVLIRDPLQLLKEPESDSRLDAFARQHDFTVIVASTNLSFRYQYEQAAAEPDIRRFIVLDRAPDRKHLNSPAASAPPPFYPDVLKDTPAEARIELDLRRILRELTGDPNWPEDVNRPRYARLIVRHLDDVLCAHRHLRTVSATRFTDWDLKIIVAYAALGIANSAFKQPHARDYWKIGLLGHQALEELERLAPEVTGPLREAFLRAPAPYRHFHSHAPDLVIHAFYLSVLLSQHSEQWRLMLGNLDPALRSLADSPEEVLRSDAPKLIDSYPEQAERDLRELENSLSREDLQFLLIEQLRIIERTGFSAVLEHERYSTLFRSLALLCALHDRLSRKDTEDDLSADFPPGFADARTSPSWSQLKEAYHLTCEMQRIRRVLDDFLTSLRVARSGDLSPAALRELWNQKRVNRLEYFVSTLERFVDSGQLLPRPEDDLPSVFSNIMQQIRERINRLAGEIHSLLEELNARFQKLVAARYANWIEQDDDDVVLTSQFLRRCLKPYWDHEQEQAVVFIFDGMRYDIWDEFLRPMLEDRMEILADLPGLSLLPSETHITRKAISAGLPPDQFDSRSGEDGLLKEALRREFRYSGDIEVVSPPGAGTGETVRYRAGNLEVYIFELCDKALHHISVKTLPDGRQVPERSLAFLYRQHLKNIIDNEVMAIVRTLRPGTRVFITADHGFGPVARKAVRLEASWLNEPGDCMYLNARLIRSLDDLNAPGRVKERVWEFPVKDLRMPDSEEYTERQTRQRIRKQYASVIFPKTGYALQRPGAHFKPDAYTHGGISLPELIIPMVALRVKPEEQGLLTIRDVTGPTEIVQDEEVTFQVQIRRTVAAEQETPLRVRIDVMYAQDPDTPLVPQREFYVPTGGIDIPCKLRFSAADATSDERKAGEMQRNVTMTVSYQDGRKTVRLVRSQRVVIRLKAENIVRRVPSSLGGILGLTPKSMR